MENSHLASDGRVYDEPGLALRRGVDEWDGYAQPALRLKGLNSDVLAYVPDFAFLVWVPDGISLAGLDIQWMGRLRPDETISAKLDGAAPEDVELYPDVDPNDGRAIASDAALLVLGPVGQAIPRDRRRLGWPRPGRSQLELYFC